MTALAPGSTIGILGGGQLGRMLAIAAAQLGYRCHIYSPEQGSIATEVSAEFTCADYTDIAALKRFVGPHLGAFGNTLKKLEPVPHGSGR